ncbi:MAG: Acyl-coenzyme A dehydrogenase [Pseudidiomarina mangrovi]|nr:MAG: Acyl-coenzyme A dehydrogenase [Pseudidiomarina mangrovi]
MSPEGAFGYLETTLRDIIKAEELFDRVRKAANQRMSFIFLDKVAAKGKELGVLNDEEVALLIRAEEGRLRTINVDDFAHEDLMAGKAARDYALANKPKKPKAAADAA